MFRISSVVSETGARGGILWLCWVRFGGKEFFFSFSFFTVTFTLSLFPFQKGGKEDPETRLWV